MKPRELLSASAALMMVSAIVVSTSCDKGGGEEETPKNTLSVSPDAAVTFEAKDNSDIVLTVTTDAEIWDYTKPSWVTARKNPADMTLTINAKENTGDERSGAIKFSAGNADLVEINVTQKKGEKAEPRPEIRTKDLFMHFSFDDLEIDGTVYNVYDAGPLNMIITQTGNVGFVDGIKGKCFSGAAQGRLVTQMVGQDWVTYYGDLLQKPKTPLPGVTMSAWVYSDLQSGKNWISSLSSVGMFYGSLDFGIERYIEKEEESEVVTKETFRVTVGLRNNVVLNQEAALTTPPPTYTFDLDKSYFEKWCHLAFKYDCSTSKGTLFVDGVKVNESVVYAVDATGTVTTDPLGQLVVGPTNVTNEGGAITWYCPFTVGSFYSDAADDWCPWFSGKIDEYRLYTAPLTDEEMTNIYKAEKTE